MTFSFCVWIFLCVCVLYIDIDILRWKFTQMAGDRLTEQTRQIPSNYTIISKDSQTHRKRKTFKWDFLHEYREHHKIFKPHFQHFTFSVTRLSNRVQHVYHASTFCVNVCLLHASALTFTMTNERKKQNFCDIENTNKAISSRPRYARCASFAARCEQRIEHQEITFVGKFCISLPFNGRFVQKFRSVLGPPSTRCVWS